LRWWRLPIEERAWRKTDLGGGDYYLRNSGLPPSHCVLLLYIYVQIVLFSIFMHGLYPSYQFTSGTVQKFATRVVLCTLLITMYLCTGVYCVLYCYIYLCRDVYCTIFLCSGGDCLLYYITMCRYVLYCTINLYSKWFSIPKVRGWFQGSSSTTTKLNSEEILVKVGFLTVSLICAHDFIGVNMF